mmetsp:Transcript_24837/g.69215  ORF Transcript_24837/g.69215 Transcript_24837/m.69215 type:complete len:1423 (-) Transcript_24837:32-4300(-)
MASYALDTADWRAALDSIVAATDTNLRAIRGLSPQRNSASPRGPAATPPGTPPWSSPLSPGGHEAVYNAAVLGRLQDKQLSAARGELSSLLTSVQSSLSELRVEVSAARKLSSSATSTLGEHGAPRAAPRYGDTPSEARLDAIEDQISRLQRSVLRATDDRPARGHRSPADDNGAALGKLQSSYKGLEEKVDSLQRSIDRVHQQVSHHSDDTPASKEMEQQVKALKASVAELEATVAKNEIVYSGKITQICAEMLSESERETRRKLTELAHALLEEQKDGPQQRMVDALKVGLQDAAKKIDEFDDRLEKVSDTDVIEARFLARIQTLETQLKERDDRAAEEGRLRALEGRLAALEAAPSPPPVVPPTNDTVAAKMREALEERAAETAEEMQALAGKVAWTEAAAADAIAHIAALTERLVAAEESREVEASKKAEEMEQRIAAAEEAAVEAARKAAEAAVEASATALAASPLQAEASAERLEELEKGLAQMSQERAGWAEGVEGRVGEAEARAAQVQEKLEVVAAAIAKAGEGDKSSAKKGKDVDKLILKVNAMGNAMVALEDEHSALLKRVEELQAKAEEKSAGKADADVLEKLANLEARVEEALLATGESMQIGDSKADDSEEAQAQRQAVKELAEAVEFLKQQFQEARLREDNQMEGREAETRDLLDQLAGQVEALGEEAAAAKASSADKAADRDEMAEELKQATEVLEDLDTRLRAVEVKSTLARAAAASAPEGAEAVSGAAEEALLVKLEELRTESRVAMEDVDIIVASAKRAAMEAESIASEVQEAMEALEPQVAELQAALGAQQAELEALKAAGQRQQQSMDISEDATAPLADLLAGIPVQLAELKAVVATLQQQQQKEEGENGEEEEEGATGWGHEAEARRMAAEVEELKKDVMELRQAVGSDQFDAAALEADFQQALDEAAHTLRSELSGLQNFVQHSLAGDGAADRLPHEAVEARLQAVEASVAHASLLLSDNEQRRAVGDLAAMASQEDADVLARQMADLSGLRAEVEALKVAVTGLEVGEATRSLAETASTGVATVPNARADAARAAEALAELKEVRTVVESARLAANRDARAAGQAASAAVAASTALQAALPALSSVLSELQPELAAVEEALAAGRQQADEALAGLGEELEEVKALAGRRVEELRGDAEAAVEALNELNVANAEAQHMAMSEQYAALQGAEERAAELEIELDNARKQVDGLNSVLQTMEISGLPGETRSAHYARQMSYMISLLQRKTAEVSALRRGAEAAGEDATSLAELEEAFAQEAVGAWTAIEEFRDTMMHFETEMGATIGELQGQMAELRQQAGGAQGWSPRHRHRLHRPPLPPSSSASPYPRFDPGTSPPAVVAPLLSESFIRSATLWDDTTSILAEDTAASWGAGLLDTSATAEAIWAAEKEMSDFLHVSVMAP